MVLEPPIDRLVQYKQMNRLPTDVRQEIPSALKALLARGTLAEALRESDSSKSVSSLSTQLRTEKSSKVPLQSKALSTDNVRTSVDKAGPDKPSVKKPKVSLTCQNFLGVGARKAKAAQSARKAAQVGFQRSKKQKTSHSGSGVPLDQVARLKYVKGFTQAVRTPCRFEDLA